MVDLQNHLQKGLQQTKKQRVALVGAGMVSSTYAAALQTLTEKLQLAGVLSARKKSAIGFLDTHKASFPEAQVFESADAIATDPSIDAVIITTPPDAREELVELFSSAGKAILMEKPIERTLQAATRLCETCEQRNVPLGIVLQHRVRPAVRQLQEILATSSLGPLLSLEISVPWWREQAYYDQPGRGSYARDGGGVLINQAIHTLDLALLLAGPVSEVNSVSSTTGFHKMEAEDFVVSALRLECGAIGSLFASTACYPGRAESIRLYFEKVTVSLEANKLLMQWHDGREESVGAVSDTGGGADPMAFTSAWHETVIDEFMQALHTGENPPITARSALGVHALIDALEVSSRDKSAVRI